MNNRKTTTVTRPRPAALLIALSAITLAGSTLTEARTQRVQDTAASVTAINRDQIENLPNVRRDIQDLTSQRPGFIGETYTDTTSRNNISLRGVNNKNTPYGGNFIDGVYVNPNNRFNADLYDVESVEVLRGPQGTLFGRNNAGVININTRGNNNFNETATNDQPTGYKYGDNRSDSRVEFNPNTFGTAGVNPGLRYQPSEPGYTPDLTIGQTWNTGRPNPQLNDLPADWTPTLNTHDPGLGVSLNTDTTEPASNPTHTPTETTTVSNPDTTADTHTGNTPTETAPTTNTHQPTTEVAETGDSTGVFNQPQGNGYAANSHPCPKVNRHEINNRIANNARTNAAGTAQSLISHSQPYYVHDYNYYNTAADELATRNAIGNQLAQGLTVTNDPITMTEPPKTYYRVAGGGDYTLISNDPPLPEYKTTVRPIKPLDMSDFDLELEIKYGPSLTEGYLREAGKLRADAERHRARAKQRREAAARARASAETSRTKAKNAKTADSREFHEQQAERYDDHADILEDSAGDLDRSAQNDDNAAERYEKDAEQTVENMGRAMGEYSHRHAKAAAEAARQHAAQQAEAARIEAARQAELDAIRRQSQQGSQNNAGNQSGSGSSSNQGNAPRRPRQPDARIPRPGKEPARETVDKLLRNN